MINVRGKDLLLIEAHCHVWEKFGGQRLGNTPIEPLGFGKAKQGDSFIQLLPPEYEDFNVRLGVLLGYMDYLHIDKALILQNPCYGDQREYVRTAIKDHPGKLAGIGMLDPRDLKKLPTEITTYVKDYGFKGVKMEIPDTPFYLDDPDYDILWKTVMDNDAYVVIDLGWNDGEYDFQVDRLAKILKKYPTIKMVLPHLGVSRLWDLNQKYPYPHLQKTLSLLNIDKDNLWIDISGIPFYDYSDEYPYYRGLEILRTVKETVGMDRMMWGSDFPTVLKLATYHQCIDLVTKHCHFLTTDDLEKLMSTNAMKVHFNHLKS